MPNSNALEEEEIQMTNKVVYAKSHEKGFRWKGEDPVKNNSIDILDWAGFETATFFTPTRYLAPFGRHFDFWWPQFSFPWR